MASAGSTVSDSWHSRAEPLPKRSKTKTVRIGILEPYQTQNMATLVLWRLISNTWRTSKGSGSVAFFNLICLVREWLETEELKLQLRLLWL